MVWHMVYFWYHSAVKLTLGQANRLYTRVSQSMQKERLTFLSVCLC